MIRLRDSSEVKEAALLLSAIVKESAEAEAGSSRRRGERLERALRDMCARGGFKGAVVVDQHGLLLAAHNAPGELGAVAAFTTMMADTLEHAEKLLKESRLNRVAVDLSYEDKGVVHRFVVDGTPYFLTIACPQEVEERSEVEVSVEQLSALIHRK